jgi:hypothetical protein
LCGLFGISEPKFTLIVNAPQSLKLPLRHTIVTSVNTQNVKQACRSVRALVNDLSKVYPRRTSGMPKQSQYSKLSASLFGTVKLKPSFDLIESKLDLKIP